MESPEMARKLSCSCCPPEGDNLITTPLCHGHARIASWGALANGRRLYIFPTTIPITGENLIQCLRISNFDSCWAVPALLKALRDAGGIELFKRLKHVVSWGSPVPDELGDALVEAGVSFSNFVASSEGGSLLDGMEVEGVWDYVRPRPLMELYFTFEQEDQGVSELVVRGAYPSLSMCNRDDGSWATNDLYTPHPSIPNTWKFYGRKDDLIIHVTGMKTNPVPSEWK